jgi:nicotinamidase-related amidase
MKQHLLIIDPQHDFCCPEGTLYVNGADKDISRLAAFLSKVFPQIAGIHVTLDCHHFFDIAHPVFWIDSKGAHPAPFTIISKSDVQSGRWCASNPIMHDYALEYVSQLENNGRYELCIWPPHCLFGSAGFTIVPELHSVLLEWEYSKGMAIDYVTKGKNIKTEHYSAMIAEVPDAADPATQLNAKLIQVLKEADRVYIAGEALSHCVANTVRDVADYLGDEHLKKFVLIEDCSSSVHGFEHLGEAFIKDMTQKGMQTARSTDI